LPTAGVKRRKNAAGPKAISKVLYIHEDMKFRDMLNKFVLTFDRQDFFDHMSFLRGEIVRVPFELRYTIARTASKNIELQTIADYTVMLAEVIMKPRPAIVMFILEIKVKVQLRTLYVTSRLLSTLYLQGLHQGEGDEASEKDDDEAGLGDGVAKKKVKGPSTEEAAQDKFIANLQVLYRCEDRKCSYDFCWPDATHARHIHLTHLHLRTWAAALEGKEDGVDMETPPNVKIFDASHVGNDATDASSLAKRRVALLQSQNNSPIVNFEGLADVI
jgi:hypothetical protein